MTGSMPMTSFAGRIAPPIAAFFILLLSAFVALPALAQQQVTELSPEHLALARKYVDLTDKSALYETTIVKAGIETQRTLVQQNPGVGDQISTAIGKVIATYKERKGELFDQFARVYALTFSMEELQQIVDFYTSPVGQKLANTSADLNASVARVLAIYTANLQTEFFGKVRAELKAMGIDT
jgi:hypothetical protein